MTAWERRLIGTGLIIIGAWLMLHSLGIMP